MKPLWVAGAIVALFAGVVGYAKLSRHWDSPIPSEAYQRLIPYAAEYDHSR